MTEKKLLAFMKDKKSMQWQNHLSFVIAHQINAILSKIRHFKNDSENWPVAITIPIKPWKNKIMKKRKENAIFFF